MNMERLLMMIQQEIWRLRDLGHKKKKVAKILGISRDTVIKYWNGPLAPAVVVAPKWALGLDWVAIQNELKNKINVKILYKEYKSSHELPSYSSFLRYMARKFPELDAPEISIKIHRKPGESAEVDYSGDSIPIYDPATGEIVKTELFVGASSYSGYFYGEFSYTQRLEDVITSHNNMFAYFGFIHRMIIPDNMKTAVTESDVFDPLINQTYHDMCKHFGIAVDPARPARPQDKPNVERAVQILQQDFFQRVRHKKYTSLYDLNRDLRDFLREKNAEIMAGRGKSRLELFEEEKKVMRVAPALPYEIFYFKKAKLHPDCSFQLERNFYTAPYLFVGKELNIKFSKNLVHAYYQTELLATHPRQTGIGHYAVQESHYPEKKIVDMGITMQSIRKDAKNIGENTVALIEKLFNAERHPLKNLKKMQGVIQLSKGYSSAAMEHASSSALEYNRLQYRFIKSCAHYYKPAVPNIIKETPLRQLELICLKGGK